MDSECLKYKVVFRIGLTPGKPYKQGGVPDQTRTRRALKIKRCSRSEAFTESTKNKEVFRIGTKYFSLFLVTRLLSAHVERGSVPRVLDFVPTSA